MQVDPLMVKELQSLDSQPGIIISCEEDCLDSSSSNIVSGLNADIRFSRTSSVESNISRTSTDSNSSNEPLPGVVCEDLGELGGLLPPNIATPLQTIDVEETAVAVTVHTALESSASYDPVLYEDMQDDICTVPVRMLTLQIQVCNPCGLQDMIAALNSVNQIKMFCCQPRFSRTGAAFGLFIAAESHTWLINVQALGDMDELWEVLGVRPDFKGKQVKLMWDSRLDQEPCHAEHAAQIRGFLGLRTKPSHKKVSSGEFVSCAPLSIMHRIWTCPL